MHQYFEEIFNDFGIHVLSDYNTATAEYNFILLFEKEEETQYVWKKHCRHAVRYR